VTRETIGHPARFQQGTRVLMLTARHKDGNETERKVFRIAHDETEYFRRLEQLEEMMRPGERIYASGCARDVAKAARIFRERQLASEYDEDPTAFYRGLENRWISCLMDPKARSEKLWMFDCDDEEDIAAVKAEVLDRGQELGIGGITDPRVHHYRTASGLHVLTPTFDRTKIDGNVVALLHPDPLILLSIWLKQSERNHGR
jgi:hypothetical protein